MKRSQCVLATVALATVLISGCGMMVSDDKVVSAVEKQGYSNVRVTAKHIFFVEIRGCGKDDEAAFSVRATNSLGTEVKLTACAGWPFKGITVRTE